MPLGREETITSRQAIFWALQRIALFTLTFFSVDFFDHVFRLGGVRGVMFTLISVVHVNFFVSHALNAESALSRVRLAFGLVGFFGSDMIS